MQLGVKLPYSDPSSTGEDLRRFIKAIDEFGFDSCWMGDHLVIPSVVDRSNYSYLWRFSEEQLSNADMATLFPSKYFLEAITSCAFIVGVSPRLRVGIGVLVVPMRNPVQLASELATLDVLSGGKVIAGVGTGWMKEEFEALDRPYADRGARLDESIAVMRRLWGEQPVSFEGDTVRFPDLYCEPVPLQPGGPPIWVGGDSKRALKRVTRLGNGWQPVELPPEQFDERSRELSRMLEDASRDPQDVARSVSTRLPLSNPRDGRAARIIEAYANAGCDHLVMYSGWRISLNDNIERAALFYDLASQVCNVDSVAAVGGTGE